MEKNDLSFTNLHTTWVKTLQSGEKDNFHSLQHNSDDLEDKDMDKLSTPFRRIHLFQLLTTVSR